MEVLKKLPLTLVLALAAGGVVLVSLPDIARCERLRRMKAA